MTQTPSPLRFRPLNHHLATISSVSGLSSEQVAALNAPLNPDEKVRAVATLQTFSVALDLSGVTLPARYLCRVWVYVLGSASVWAPLSHNPTAPKLPRVKLFRLLGGEAENSSTVQVSLPQAAPVRQLVCEVRGLFDPSAI